jgi:hypothetical protein
MIVKDKNASIEMIAENLQTMVYPNPATKELSIIASENTNISLTDVSGKTIIEPSEIQANTTYTMQLQNIASGVYLVKIASKHSTKTERVVIQ